MNNELLRGGELLPLVEDFYTIQGEGFHAGKPAYFIRLGGCDVGCTAQSIVITGGEPLLYPLGPLTAQLRERGLKIFLETSGSHPFSGEFDWVCLSPKTKQPPLTEAYGRADELKVIIGSVADFEWAEQCAAKVSEECMLFLQPEWSVYEEILPALVEYAKANPRWNISVQTHKFMHIP